MAGMYIAATRYQTLFPFAGCSSRRAAVLKHIGSIKRMAQQRREACLRFALCRIQPCDMARSLLPWQANMLCAAAERLRAACLYHIAELARRTGHIWRAAGRLYA